MRLFSEVSGDGVFIVSLETKEIRHLLLAMEALRRSKGFVKVDPELEDELKSLVFMDRMVDRAENGRIADLLAEHFGAEATQ